MELLCAFSTNDGKSLVRDHAGMATYFDVYRITEDSVEFVERRRNAEYKGDEANIHGDPEKAKASLGALKGMDIWANQRFGPNLPRLLKKLVCVVVRTDNITDAVELVQRNLDAVAEQYALGESRKHIVLKPE